MTLANIGIKTKPPTSVRGLLVVTETNNCNFIFYVQKCATIKANASAIVVSVGTTSTAPHIIGSPVYITHSESITV